MAPSTVLRKGGEFQISACATLVQVVALHDFAQPKLGVNTLSRPSTGPLQWSKHGFAFFVLVNDGKERVEFAFDNEKSANRAFDYMKEIVETGVDLQCWGAKSDTGNHMTIEMLDIVPRRVATSVIDSLPPGFAAKLLINFPSDPRYHDIYLLLKSRRAEDTQKRKQP